jgi:predicted ArsR family transcriptional regulator
VRELERERVTVQEAARQLGITESAVRKRVQRGILRHDKEADGRLYVYLDTRDTDRDEVRDSSYDMLVRRLENENEFLRRELERKDTILLNMTEAMKALSPPPQETPPGERESPQTVEEEPERAEPRPVTVESQESVQRPWWRRVFGG